MDDRQIKLRCLEIAIEIIESPRYMGKCGNVINLANEMYQYILGAGPKSEPLKD